MSWMASTFGLILAKSPVQIIFIDLDHATAVSAFMPINVRDLGLGRWVTAQSPARKDTMYQSRFKTVDGEIHIASENESTGASILRSSLTVGHSSMTNASRRDLIPWSFKLFFDDLV
jgi:hypothetical protein